MSEITVSDRDVERVLRAAHAGHTDAQRAPAVRVLLEEIVRAAASDERARAKRLQAAAKETEDAGGFVLAAIESPKELVEPDA
jgi:hypothetical protein